MAGKKTNLSIAACFHSISLRGKNRRREREKSQISDALFEVCVIGNWWFLCYFFSHGWKMVIFQKTRLGKSGFFPSIVVWLFTLDLINSHRNESNWTNYYGRMAAGTGKKTARSHIYAKFWWSDLSELVVFPVCWDFYIFHLAVFNRITVRPTHTGCT